MHGATIRLFLHFRFSIIFTVTSRCLDLLRSVSLTHPLAFLLHVVYVSNTYLDTNSLHQWCIQRTQHEANHYAIINIHLLLQLTPGQVQSSAGSKSLYRMFFLQKKRVILRQHKTLFKIIILRKKVSVVIVFFYQLDAQFLYFNTFITFLYMFRALLCSSSGGKLY